MEHSQHSSQHPSSLYKKIGGGFLLGILGVLSLLVLAPHTETAQAAQAFDAPPFAEPSSYYILPHFPLTASGRYFTPGEYVTIRQINTKTGKRTVIATTTADSSGQFTVNITPVNPYSYASTTQTYDIEGESSNRPVTFSVVFGSYFPQITPSTYLAIGGQAVQITGQGFAPNEPVAIYGNGGLLATTYAGRNGVIGITIRMPVSGSAYTVLAQGLWSRKLSARTITLMQ